MLEKYGNYSVIAIPIIKNYFKYTCRCDCGRIKEVYKYDLFSGKSTQCRSCQVTESKTIHNLSHTKAHQVWKDMISRCYSMKNKNFYNYGGRGITVCDEWKNDFLEFYKWFSDSDYKIGLTLDRAENSGNYEPNNCRFVDMSIQNSNRRSKNRYIGVSKTKNKYLKFCGCVSYKGVLYLHKSFSSEVEASTYRALVIINNELPNRTEWSRVEI